MIRVFVHFRRAAKVPVPIILVADARGAVRHRGGRGRGGPPDHQGAGSRDRMPRGRCPPASGHGAVTIGNGSVDRFQGYPGSPRTLPTGASSDGGRVPGKSLCREPSR